MRQSFSSVFEVRDAEVRGILAQVRCPSVERVGELLEREEWGLKELGELLEVGREPGAEKQFAAMREFVEARFRNAEGNTVRYVAPIYVSSYCVDTCGYCNFSAARKTAVRKRLTAEELDAEVGAVMESGARVIELVYATDPELTVAALVRDAEAAVRALSGEPGAGVLLCTGHLSGAAYQALAEAGVMGIVQWDETLDRAAYDRWHSASPHKRAFRERMDNHDRAMEAGLEVATGALFGLADYRYDALMQVAKARHLEAEHGRGPFVFGVPRLKPIAGRELHPATEVSDRAYETALMVYRLAMPVAGRWLQTRETFSMNLRNLLDGDALTYRCGEVRPGGHAEAGEAAGGQFGVHELEREFVEKALAERGFRIDYAWMGERSSSKYTRGWPLYATRATSR